MQVLLINFNQQRKLNSAKIKMPYVNIKVTREDVTKEQKEQLISGVTQRLVDVLGKNPKTTFIIIDEVETDNWDIAGQSVTHLRSLENQPE